MINLILNKLLLLVFVCFSFLLAGQDRAYQLFDSEGKVMSYNKMIRLLKKQDVVFFGEYHDNPVCHWLQLEVSKSLILERDSKIIFGAEFFERDNQLIIDEYLSGAIAYKHLKTEAKVWDNFHTDYAPLLKYAKSVKAPFVATNVPRRYASMVARDGLEVLKLLPGQAKRLMMPLDFKVDTNLACYNNMLKSPMGHSMGMSPMNMVYAQAMKDATMAESIMRNSKLGYLFLHFNGAYHTDYKEGIAYYLNVYNARKPLDFLCISMVEQPNITSLNSQHFGKADIIICVDEDFTKSY